MFNTYLGNCHGIFTCLLIRYFDSFVRFDLLKHLTDYVLYLMTSFIIWSNFHSFSFVLSFKWCLLDFLLNLTDIFWFTLPIISFILIFIYLCEGNHHFKANNKKKISAVCVALNGRWSFSVELVCKWYGQSRQHRKSKTLKWERKLKKIYWDASFVFSRMFLTGCNQSGLSAFCK